MNASLWLLAVAGSALVLTQSSLTAPLRDRLSRYAEEKPDDHRTWPPCPGCSAYRAWQLKALAAKLISCPMCSGFWLGAGWAVLFGERAPVMLAANGFAGSIVAALAVALWLALGEAHAALSLWRYLNPVPTKPTSAARRVPLFMRAAILSDSVDSPFVCHCGETVDGGTPHVLSEKCGILSGSEIGPLPDGIRAAYLNPMSTTTVCGCGTAVYQGSCHVLTDRCDGKTSLYMGS